MPLIRTYGSTLSQHARLQVALRRAVAILALIWLVTFLCAFTERSLIPVASFPSRHGTASRSSSEYSKIALLIETRPVPHLAPLLLHFAAVLPHTWPIVFLGSPDSLRLLQSSAAVRAQSQIDRLALQSLPKATDLNSPEKLSRFLTFPETYNEIPMSVKWIFIFQTDSMICGNSAVQLEDYLEYDWVGAPWDPDGECGGNGGLSLRRTSKIRQVLNMESRERNMEPEDVWFSRRLCRIPGTRMANGSVSLTFSGEMYSGSTAEPKVSGQPHGKFYEPMGYHTGGSGSWLHGAIWGTPELRSHIYDYCPEVKMMLKMDLAEYMPGECRSNWTD